MCRCFQWYFSGQEWTKNGKHDSFFVPTLNLLHALIIRQSFERLLIIKVTFELDQSRKSEQGSRCGKVVKRAKKFFNRTTDNVT